MVCQMFQMNERTHCGGKLWTLSEAVYLLTGALPRGLIMSLTVHSSTAETFTHTVQDEEESFDLGLIASLEVDVVPHIAKTRVPDDVVVELAKTLRRASRVLITDEDDDEKHADEEHPVSGPNRGQHLNAKVANGIAGTTAVRRLAPRERFSYWCFDLLFLICSDTAKGTAALRLRRPLTNGADAILQRKRLAALAIPSLLQRCKEVLASYVADDSLRGSAPFTRYEYR